MHIVGSQAADIDIGPADPWQVARSIDHIPAGRIAVDRMVDHTPSAGRIPFGDIPELDRILAAHIAADPDRIAADNPVEDTAACTAADHRPLNCPSRLFNIPWVFRPSSTTVTVKSSTAAAFAGM